MWNPKPVTFRSKKYHQFVKTLDCCVNDGNCQGDTVPHHTSTGGTGMKGSDLDEIPLCHYHHDEHDRMGKLSFYDDNNIDRWKCVADTLKKFIIHILSKK